MVVSTIAWTPCRTHECNTDNTLTTSQKRKANDVHKQLYQWIKGVTT